MTRHVLWVTEKMENLGGSEYMTVIGADLLSRAGIRVTVVTLGNCHPAWKRHLARERVSLLTVASSEGARYDGFVTTLKEIIRSAEPDLIHFMPLGSAVKEWLLARPVDVPVVATEPTDLSDACYWLEDSTLRACRGLDGLVVLNGHALHCAYERIQCTGPIALIPNTVLGPTKELENDQEGMHRIGCISRLSQEKGLEFLVASFSIVLRSIPDVYLRIYGHGEDEQRLCLLTQMLGIADNVEIGHTFQPITGIDDVARQCSVFALSSLFEGMPLSVLELMARGKVVIATDTHGARDALGADSGTVVPIGDTKALADVMAYFLLHAEARVRAGRRNRERFKSLFGNDMFVHRLLSFYDTVMAGGPFGHD